MHGKSCVVIRLYITNHSPAVTFESIHMANAVLLAGMSLVPFDTIPMLVPGETFETNIHVDFGQKTQAAKFDIVRMGASHTVSLVPEVGELLRPMYDATVASFDTIYTALTGMHDNSFSVDAPTVIKSVADWDIVSRVSRCSALGVVASAPADGMIRFGGTTLLADVPVLVSVMLVEAEGRLSASCSVRSENAFMGASIVGVIKAALKSSKL